MNSFKGVWKNLQCGGAEDIQNLLKDAKLLIDDAEKVSWQFAELEPCAASVEFVDGRLRGRFPVEAPQYYYEVVARRPPDPIKTKTACLYGIVSKIDQSPDGGEDLGDTGTWKAEEQHPEG